MTKTLDILPNNKVPFLRVDIVFFKLFLDGKALQLRGKIIDPKFKVQLFNIISRKYIQISSYSN